jgi:hypothetical protein
MCVRLEKNMTRTTQPPFRRHLRSSDDLVTTYEATRAGFVALALEKNRRASPYVAEARALQEAASKANTPADLLNMKEIEAGLFTAAGLSDKALNHLLPEDKAQAARELVKNFLEPAGTKFVEELVFRFLLIRGDTLGGSMRNIGGVIAQPSHYLVLGELKGGIDPAGADEHWKTARTAIERIRSAFSKVGFSPLTFFVGAAVEKKMAAEIWEQLETGALGNAANLNETNQVASISQWLCNL